MGGDKPSGFRPVKEDLVYRTEGTGEPEKHYSDDYTKRIYEDRKKERDDLMEALSRLGFVPEAWPRSFPQVPYRASEQEFGF